MSKEQEVIEELFDIMACLIGGQGLFSIDKRLARIDRELDEILEKEEDERLKVAIEQAKEGACYIFEEVKS